MIFKKSLEERVIIAKNDDREMENLIEEFKPFIASVAQNKVGRFLRYGHDDELTVGMMAFKEAIDSFDNEKGKFLSFARQVISLRMIDYYRKNKEKNNIIYINMSEEEEKIDFGAVKAIEKHSKENENEERKLEILQYKKELKEWGITFENLVEVSPKQERLRKIYKDIAYHIASNQELMSGLLKTKRLPIKEIEKKLKVHRKKIERGRIYIIALLIVIIGDYEYIKEYVDWR